VSTDRGISPRRRMRGSVRMVGRLAPDASPLLDPWRAEVAEGPRSPWANELIWASPSEGRIGGKSGCFVRAGAGALGCSFHREKERVVASSSPGGRDARARPGRGQGTPVPERDRGGWTRFPLRPRHGAPGDAAIDDTPPSSRSRPRTSTMSCGSRTRTGRAGTSAALSSPAAGPLYLRPPSLTLGPESRKPAQPPFHTRHEAPA